MLRVRALALTRTITTRATTFRAATTVITAWSTGVAAITRALLAGTGATLATAAIATTVTAITPTVIAALITVLMARTAMAMRGAALRRGRALGRFLAGQRQQLGQLLGGDALERAEIGFRQLGGLKVTQQRGTLVARLVFFAADGVFLGAAGVLVGAAAGQLVGGHLAVLFGQFASRLAVQVKTLRALGHGDQVGRGPGVAAQEGRQHGLGEDTGRALLDIGLDAQLQRLGTAGEQGREELLEAVARGSRAHLFSLGWRFGHRRASSGLLGGCRCGRGFGRRGVVVVGRGRGRRGHETGAGSGAKGGRADCACKGPCAPSALIGRVLACAFLLTL